MMRNLVARGRALLTRLTGSTASGNESVSDDVTDGLEPHWGSTPWNGDSTLHRGVWVADHVKRPSNAELDEFRRAYWQRKRVHKFTLVEGEQVAPYGPNQKLVRVRAQNNAGTVEEGYIPTFCVYPVVFDPDHGWGGTSVMGQLPCEMRMVVDAVDPSDGSTGTLTTRDE
jgi:hypothetical protein